MDGSLLGMGDTEGDGEGWNEPDGAGERVKNGGKVNGALGVFGMGPKLSSNLSKEIRSR